MAAEFEEFEITWSEDVFEGAPRPSRRSQSLECVGVSCRARKPG